ncbi:MAG: TetR/AcrR family transcriptional regulator [Pseudomonadota bacterium]
MTNQTQSRETYHHGSLPEVLIDEGAKLLAEKGIDRFSMREVARRAGVAVAAPSHHFGNAKGLLTAIATQGFRKLETQMAAAAAALPDPQEKVVAMCQTYLGMGVNDPGYAAIMFRLERLDESDQRFREQSFRAFDLFADALKQAASKHVDDAQISYAAKTLWAAMHGLVDLEMIKDQEAEALIRFAVRTVLAGIR